MNLSKEQREEDEKIALALREVNERMERFTRKYPVFPDYKVPMYRLSKKRQQFVKRFELMCELRRQKKTYEEIAKTVTPQVTRERVRQLFKAHAPELTGWKIARKSLKKVFTYTCRRCGKEFTRYRQIKRIYCSHACRRETPEERANRIAENWKRFQAYHRNRMETDPEYKKKFHNDQVASQKRWWAKLSPEQRQNYKDRQRKRQAERTKIRAERRKTDPAYRATERAKQVAREQRRKERSAALLAEFLKPKELVYAEGVIKLKE